MSRRIPIFLLLMLACGSALADEKPFSDKQIEYLNKYLSEHDALREAKWWSKLREAYARDPKSVIAELKGEKPVPPAPPPSVKLASPASDVQRVAESIALPAPPSDGAQPLSMVPENRDVFVVSDNDKEAGKMTVTEPSVTGPIGQPTADRNVRGTSSVVQIDGSAGSSTGTIVLSLPRTTSSVGDSVRTRQWAITASTVIDNKEQGSATFANLDGPANGSSLGFDYTFTTTKRNTGAFAMADLCHLRGYNLSTCVDDFGDHIPESLRSSRDEYLSALKKLQESAHWGLVFNVHGSVLHNDYTYYGLPTADSSAPKHTAGKTGWKLGAEFGGTTPVRDLFLGGGFDFVHSYKEDKDRVVCPEADTPTFDCQSGKFSPPKDQVGRQLYFEARSMAFNSAYSFRATHDLASDKNAFDLPIFLFGSKDAVFTGGVRFGWTTDDHFLAGIFVGKPFDLPMSH